MERRLKIIPFSYKHENAEKYWFLKKYWKARQEKKSERMKNKKSAKFKMIEVD
jgi:hypothetical protein